MMRRNYFCISFAIWVFDFRKRSAARLVMQNRTAAIAFFRKDFI